MKQKEAVLEYIRKNGSATVREIFNLGINCPTAVISDINAEADYTGIRILKVMIAVNTRWSKPTQIARYVLSESNPKKPRPERKKPGRPKKVAK